MDPETEKLLTGMSVDAGLGAPERIEVLRPHASARQIYRLHLAGSDSVVGIVHDDEAENAAFVGFTRSFFAAGLPVPEILAWNGRDAYLESDLGDVTLYDVLQAERTVGNLSAASSAHYRAAVEALVTFQTQGLALIDKDLCYQGARFDAAAMAGDYDAFISEYAARVGFEAAAQAARTDFVSVVDQCSAYEPGFFMYRDFQARNIMVTQKGLGFIDYQSGREGPLHYDLASLLFQAKADLPFAFREQLLEAYLDRLAEEIAVDRKKFRRDFLLFVLIRAIQTLGVYGREGLGAGKNYFREAIPYAQRNISYLEGQIEALGGLGNLKTLLREVATHE